MLALESLVDILKKDRRLTFEMTQPGVYEVATHEASEALLFGKLVNREGRVNFLIYPYLTQDEEASTRFAKLTRDMLSVLQQHGLRQQNIQESLATEPEFKTLFEKMIEDAADLLTRDYADMGQK